MRRILRWIEHFLLIAGVIGLGLGIGAYAIPFVWQDWGNWQFDHEKRGETATVGGYLEHKKDQLWTDLRTRSGHPPPPVPEPPGAQPMVAPPPAPSVLRP